MIQRPTHALTGRTQSLLEVDLANHADGLTEALSGKSVLVIGGAGSIGSETVSLLAYYPLRHLVIVDQDENGLARLTRRLRGHPKTLRAESITTLPYDFGSAVFHASMNRLPAFDFVLNFAALKHVRSEKDTLTTFQMLDTNILKPARLLDWLESHSPSARYFSVSTDKAANPVSFMGASKRVMEHVTFQKTNTDAFESGATSARFANVAYSAGSLLESFVQRIETDTPLAAPDGIKRFFMTLEESGEFCLLASILGEAGQIYIPDLDPQAHLIEMRTAAEVFLSANGYSAEIYALEQQDQAFRDFDRLKADKKWPLILTPSDTAGEKPYEEFVGSNESLLPGPFSALNAVPYTSELSQSALVELIEKLEYYSISSQLETLTSDDLTDWIAAIEPAFRESHIRSDRSLDDRI
ncbi:MAG: nucleoside-diphosphate sugar epimerase [Ponticaulis sp.]|nr:nucleoside-diphosphate sugar epimerase [Ponticaulis sp.]|tara:strand:- start:6596 stop:7831 length:1236 start_codon:yes stop_codon:yes gene_type:complete